MSSLPEATATPPGTWGDGGLVASAETGPEAPLGHLFAAAAAHREAGRTVVAVQGLGLVGTAVATAIAAARDADGAPHHAVIGVELPTPEGAARVARLNAGEPPATTPDAELAAVLRQAVCDDGNLWATTHAEALALADVIVVDVPLDAPLDGSEVAGTVQRALFGFETAIRRIGRHMRAGALVLVETTVPVGICARTALPLLREERTRRGIETPVRLAHAYERVAPGPPELRSVRRIWRVYSGVDEASAERARAFLSSFTDTTEFPLRQLESTSSSELAKLLENSYLAVTIALMHEWTLLAEAAGVDLFAVVDAIRMRRGTHDDMSTPGFGAGGHRPPQDALLAQWSAEHLYGLDASLSLSLHALRIDARMPLHTASLTREVSGGTAEGVRVLVCGVSSLPEMPAARSSPAAVLVDALTAGGARVTVHDPHVTAWRERPAVPLAPSLADGLAGADTVVFAIRHEAYAALSTRTLLGHPALHGVVDACDVIADDAAAALSRAGRRVAGVGKGHWRARGFQCAH